MGKGCWMFKNCINGAKFQRILINASVKSGDSACRSAEWICFSEENMRSVPASVAQQWLSKWYMKYKYEGIAYEKYPNMIAILLYRLPLFCFACSPHLLEEVVSCHQRLETLFQRPEILDWRCLSQLWQGDHRYTPISEESCRTAACRYRVICPVPSRVQSAGKRTISRNSIHFS